MQTVIVTGVSRGLGCALARGFAAQGLRVFGCARGAQALAALARELGEPHRFEAVDVADARAVVAWADRCEPPDLLINNAALMNRAAPAWELSAAEFDALLAVNVSGAMNVARAFLPRMLARGSGLLVNFSSGWGRSTAPHVAPYCASKFAIEGLTRALAQELADASPGVGALAVNPGIIDTDMLRTCWAAGAAGFPDPAEWARRAVPALLALSASDNGRSLDL